MEWVNSIRGPNLTIFFQYITWLGYKDFLFLFVPFCYWFFDRKVFSTFTLFVFIGLDSPVIKSHGGTDYIGFSNSLDVCCRIIKGNLIEKIKKNI